MRKNERTIVREARGKTVKQHGPYPSRTVALEKARALAAGGGTLTLIPVRKNGMSPELTSLLKKINAVDKARIKWLAQPAPDASEYMRLIKRNDNLHKLANFLDTPESQIASARLAEVHRAIVAASDEAYEKRIAYGRAKLAEIEQEVYAERRKRDFVDWRQRNPKASLSAESKRRITLIRSLAIRHANENATPARVKTFVDSYDWARRGFTGKSIGATAAQYNELRKAFPSKQSAHDTDWAAATLYEKTYNEHVTLIVEAAMRKTYGEDWYMRAHRTSYNPKPATRRNHHLRVGAKVWHDGEPATVTETHAGDRYTVRCASGMRADVAGSTLRTR
jgi:hypothetical protein